MKKLLLTFLATTALSLSVSTAANAAWDPSALETFVEGLDIFWETALSERGIDYQLPVIYTQNTESTPCGPMIIGRYCLATNTIHLDISAMDSLAYSIGDSAVYWVVAHEYSHAVQNHLGLFSSNASTTALELQADCLAGTFFAVAEYAGLLEPGDFEEGLTTAFVFGDANVESPDSHGSPVQRLSAFANGFTDPRSCFANPLMETEA